MDSSIHNFLSRAFSAIISGFPSVTLEYKYSTLTQSHIVKVSPVNTYHSQAFMDLEGELNKLWLSIETEDDFGIVTAGSIVDTSNMELIYSPTPQEYKVTIKFRSVSAVNNSNLSATNTSVLIQENQTFKVSLSKPSLTSNNNRQFGMAA